MARGSDILYHPPRLVKNPAWSLQNINTFYYPRESDQFLLRDGLFWISDGNHLYKKAVAIKEGEESQKIVDIRTLTPLGAISFSGSTPPTFHSTREINGEKEFVLGASGLRYPLVAAYPLLDDDPVNPKGSIYGIDREGNLYMHLISSGPWREVGDKVECFLTGPDGMMLIHKNLIIFSDGRGRPSEIKTDLSKNSQLHTSQKFVEYQDTFLFLGSDGLLRDLEENVFCPEKIKDIARGEDNLSLLTESDEMIIYHDLREVMRKPLDLSYEKILLDEEHVVLFSGVSEDHDHLDRADVFLLQSNREKHSFA